MKANRFPTVCRVWDAPGGTLSYNEERKIKAHRDGRALLREFAANWLNLQPDQYDLRSNMGGIAVSGEVTLHTDPTPGNTGIYIQISQSCLGSGASVLFRTCKHRKDYSGGHNNFVSCTTAFATQVAMAQFAYNIARLTKIKAPALDNAPAMV